MAHTRTDRSDVVLPLPLDRHGASTSGDATMRDLLLILWNEIWWRWVDTFLSPGDHPIMVVLILLTLIFGYGLYRL